MYFSSMKYSVLTLLAVLLAAILLTCGPAQEGETREETETRPNIILILADDMGYGDARVYNPDSKIPTPHLNSLAADGMLFTDAHTTSAVCTPTRYGILTGMYSWRGPLKSGVTWSYDTLIVDTTMTTVASQLAGSGYRTACVGKWHLGLGWEYDAGSVDFSRRLYKAPTDVGFDYFYGIPASLDIPPYVYIRNDRVVDLPVDSTAGSPRKGGIFWREGWIAPGFDHYQTLNQLTSEVERTVREAADGDEPFFVYFPLTAPHMPWSPREEFVGKSEAGLYGDLTHEVDDVVGRIVALTRELDIEENTLIVFTSDNGSQFSSENMVRYDHRANGDLRGRKGDVYEGGHRVPFIVKWPARITAGSRTDQLVSTTDFYATFGDIAGYRAPGEEIKDSESFLPVLTGEGAGARESMIYHSAKGVFALREGNQVLIRQRGSGGFMEVQDTSLSDPPYQLYDLGQDLGQAVNISEEQPQRVEEMLARLADIRQRGQADSK